MEEPETTPVKEKKKKAVVKKEEENKSKLLEYISDDNVKYISEKEIKDALVTDIQNILQEDLSLYDLNRKLSKSIHNSKVLCNHEYMNWSGDGKDTFHLRCKICSRDLSDKTELWESGPKLI